MPKCVNFNPAYRHHKASDQAVVTIDGHDHYLGPWRSQASRTAYDRLVSEWLANGRRVQSAPSETTIAELLAAYWDYAKSYYNDQSTGQLDAVKGIIRLLREPYGCAVAVQFGPLALKAVRLRMVDSGWSRTHVNQQIQRIRRIFKYGVENEMIPPETLAALEAVSGLRRGKTNCKESEPVKPVAEEHVEHTLPCLSPTVADMVRLQLLTGMRSGELIIMRGSDLTTTGPVWIYTPAKHKTQWKGHSRLIFIGPKAQEIVQKYLKADTTAYLFSPAEAEAQRRQLLHEQRTTPQGYGNNLGTNKRRRPMKAPGACYSVASYRRAIAEACADAFDMPAELRKGPKDETEQAKADRLAKASEWRKKNCWHPHQLRHTAATKLRREFGIDAARTILGHSTLDATQIYAEADAAKAKEIAKQVG